MTLKSNFYLRQFVCVQIIVSTNIKTFQSFKIVSVFKLSETPKVTFEFVFLVCLDAVYSEEVFL